MSVTYLNNNPASDAQRQYLRSLMATRDTPPEVARLAHIAEHSPGRLTVSQASELIDALKNTKTTREVERDQQSLECSHARSWYWGGACDCGCNRISPASEEVVALRWDDLLERHFYIQREVWGTHMTGQRLRIDRILWPRFNWSDGTDTPIGFEIKTWNGAKKGPRQAADYAATIWDIETPFPWNEPPAHRMLLIGLHVNHRDESRALEPFGGFGFVFEPAREPDLRLYYNGALMWSAQNGVRPTRWGARRKIGSH